MNKTFYLLLLFSITHFSVMAQTILPDGVYGTYSYLKEIKDNYADENKMSFDLNAIDISVNIPIRLHIIRNMSGNAGVSFQDVNNSVITANIQFKKMGIQFFIDSVNDIKDYNYTFISNNSNTRELLEQFAVPNKINLFLADNIDMGSISYGYTYFPNEPNNNYIFLNKDFATGNYLTTLLGHFMGLLSTQESGQGYELANESNCASSGDYICDTYADPDLYNQVDDECKYTGTERDGNGMYYVPSVANIMSNSKDQCKCIFTPLQYRRMYYYYLKYRQNLALNK